MVHDKALHEPADFGQTLSLTQASHRPECRERRRWTVPPKPNAVQPRGKNPETLQSFDTSSLPSASNQNDDPDPLAPDFATRKLGLPLPVHPRPATGGPQSGPDDSSRRADSADIDIAVSEECRRPAQVVDNHHRPDLLRGSSRVLEKFSASCRRGEIESSLAGPTQAQLPFALVQVLQGCIMVRVYCRAAGRSGTLQPRRGRAKGLLPEVETTIRRTRGTGS
ncbi:hypothetical protein POX_d04975 [Penicillium oxalicum]|uniref:hypothetical protein n=1 Tax=Penicillium oxalicum TaxID=69781 RepID=UPI0020B7EC83|nr:hypothetical protein POX_d04975 [Penicillium oxalicum]KAI2789483.1 hypothetical protein POX_d04975 [Penicillium oxalicum]